MRVLHEERKTDHSCKRSYPYVPDEENKIHTEFKVAQRFSAHGHKVPRFTVGAVGC